jgi:asparagine synthase (glutamine-hydrolysing)
MTAMCGIAGIVGGDGAIEPDLVGRMCALLEHRGPDSRGYFDEDDGVALGVTRLAVIDVAGGDQPIFNEDRSVVVVCNGEIYNYVELRRQLVHRGHRLATRSDTEVIVHLYEELGEACVQQLRGMYAFAVWDRRERRLLLARDRVGKKPLFYAARGNRLWFASEPRAILADERVPRDVDLQALDLFLHYQVVPSPRTAFSAIRKLQPAHVLTWGDGVASTRRYWKLSYRDRYAQSTTETVCELIRETLLEATRVRLRSDVPVGALLSGGLDSSAVVAAMARQSDRPVKTFSIGFELDEFDERASAREVARMFATEHHELVLDATAMELLPRLAWHYGEPFADASALATFALAELASGHVTVALNGDGGDESFGGYARHARPVPADPIIRRYAERRVRMYFDGDSHAELYTPEFRDNVGALGWRAFVEEPYHASDAAHPTERILDVDAQVYLSEDLLVKMDIAAMGHSLEARSPLCDQRMMELAAALPMSMKVPGSTTKALFKQAMRDWLPQAIVERPKMGFMIPVADWLPGSVVADVLLDPRAAERGLFRQDRVRSLVRDYGRGEGTHEYRIWTLLMLELWFRTYIDRSAVDCPIALSVV